MNRSLLGIITLLALALPLHAGNASRSKASSAEAERQVLQIGARMDCSRNQTRRGEVGGKFLTISLWSLLDFGDVTDKEGFIKAVVGDENDVIPVSQDLSDETIR